LLIQSWLTSESVNQWPVPQAASINPSKTPLGYKSRKAPSPSSALTFWGLG
jgi:hypothetical protein